MLEKSFSANYAGLEKEKKGINEILVTESKRSSKYLDSCKNTEVFIFSVSTNDYITYEPVKAKL